MNHIRTILWNNRSQDNYECCSLFGLDNKFQLRGVSILKTDNLPMRVSYSVECTSDWKTRYVELDVWRGNHQQQLVLSVDEQQRWWQDENELVEYRGLVDVDLGFTPATNTLPIRRMQLGMNESEVTTTVWVQFPTLNIVRYPQRYTRINTHEYLFESLIDTFKAKLIVDETGLVTDYETGWRQIIATE